MDEKVLNIIKKSKYLENLVSKIPEEMLEFFLDRLQLQVSGISSEVIHLKMGQNDEYMNFVELLDGIEIQEYCLGGMDNLPGRSQAYVPERTAVIHYCTQGHAEIIIDSGQKYAYMKPGILCIEWHQEVGKKFNFYDSLYGGMEIIISMDSISADDEKMLKRLGVDLEVLREEYDKNGSYYIGQCPERLKTAFDYLVDIIRDGRKDKSTYLVTALYAINLIRTEEICISDRQFYLTKGQRRIVQEIHDRCISCLNTDISMAELEEAYNMSSVSLNKYFETMYGSTIKRYMQDMRMKLAAKKLKETTASVFDIAMSVGYESQSKFGTVFKRKYGYTPLEYRRLYGGR